jgi:hypothetical protein
MLPACRPEPAEVFSTTNKDKRASFKNCLSWPDRQAILAFVWTEWGELQRASVTTSGVPSGIRTRYLSKTSSSWFFPCTISVIQHVVQIGYLQNINSNNGNQTRHVTKPWYINILEATLLSPLHLYRQNGRAGSWSILYNCDRLTGRLSFRGKRIKS